MHLGFNERQLLDIVRAKGVARYPVREGGLCRGVVCVEFVSPASDGSLPRTERYGIGHGKHFIQHHTVRSKTGSGSICT